MKDLQKMGGIAALYAGAAYIVGMVGFLSVVDISGVVDPVSWHIIAMQYQHEHSPYGFNMLGSEDKEHRPLRSILLKPPHQKILGKIAFVDLIEN